MQSGRMTFLKAVSMVSNVGLAIDIRRPNFDWTSVIDITKRSLSFTSDSVTNIMFGSVSLTTPVDELLSGASASTQETAP